MTSTTSAIGSLQRILVVWIVIVSLIALGSVIAILAIGGRPDPVASRAAATLLNGPWRFHTGDDLRWARADTNDSGWETIDLSAAPDSHDGDVGWPDYVGGWMAHGHPGYQGYAWYRRTVEVPAGAELWDLLGPTLVDDGYEVYWNGERLGGSTQLGAVPRLVGTRPMLYALPADAAGRRSVLAVRTFMQSSVDYSADSGGMHTAPMLAPRSASGVLHSAQWWRTIAGYVVDLIEPIAMFLLAGMALVLRSHSSRRGFIVFASIALALSAVKRIGNPIFYWTDLLSLTTSLWLVTVLWMPLSLAAWTLAWNRWCARPWRVIDITAIALAVAGAVGGAWHVTALTQGSRLGSLALFALIAARMLRDSPMRIMAVATMAFVAITQFADELSSIGVPGIWFPFGIGVSRTQYAYAIAIPLLALLIVRSAMDRRRSEDDAER